LKTITALLLVTLVAILTVSLADFRSDALTNLGLVSLLKVQACDPGWFVCKVLPSPYPLIEYEGNRDVIQKVQGWLEKALILQPQSEALRLHLAENAFAQGDREKAARYLDELKVNIHRRGPLLQESRYEARLVKARQEAISGDWEAAVRDYRLGLAWGDERSLPVDERDYFRALAELEKEKIARDPSEIQAIYRVGRFLAQADEWDASIEYLNHLDDKMGLSNRQAAWAITLLGEYYEKLGQTDNAINQYDQARQADPELRQPYVYLLELLRQTGQNNKAAKVEEELQKLGPLYHLGAQGENYRAYEPNTLPNGRTLVGFDVDEEMLEQAKNLELILWWQSDENTPPGVDWTMVGDYWLQRQTVINLYPNAGFEWGVDERGIPLGYDREIYGAPQGSLLVQQGFRRDGDSNILVTNNSKNVNHVALSSVAMPVNNEDQYLMSGWIKDEWGAATLGRGCYGKNINAPSPYYIVQYESEKQLSKWVFHAQLSSPQPGYKPEQCEILVMNDSNSVRPAQFDNILFARIALP